MPSECSVVVTGMSPHEILMTRLIDVAVSGDVIVVARKPEAGAVAGNERGNRERAVLACRTAVNHY